MNPWLITLPISQILSGWLPRGLGWLVCLRGRSLVWYLACLVARWYGCSLVWLLAGLVARLSAYPLIMRSSSPGRIRVE